MMTRMLLAAAGLAICAPQAWAGDVAAGAARYAADCAHCHGLTGRGLGAFPAIARRDAGFIAERLERYRAGETVGPNSMLMIPMATELTDEQIADLSAFIAETFR